jgi:small subunit ribosomal protein S6
MDTRKRTYETTFIINASLEDTQVDAVIGRVQDTITKNGGAIKALDKWGRKRLAYSIRKKTNGFYVNIEFEAPSTLLSQLERSYQLDEMILRYLTIQLDSKALAARAAGPAVIAKTEAPPPAPAREPLFGDLEESSAAKP